MSRTESVSSARIPSGAESSRVESSGMEWSGVEWSGVEWSRVEENEEESVSTIDHIRYSMRKSGGGGTVSGSLFDFDRILLSLPLSLFFFENEARMRAKRAHTALVMENAQRSLRIPVKKRILGFYRSRKYPLAF